MPHQRRHLSGAGKATLNDSPPANRADPTIFLVHDCAEILCTWLKAN